MIDKLKNYVEKIFEDAPKTKKSNELKEELIANLIDKYNDLKASGKTDEESYNLAVASIGDIGELVQTLKEGDVLGYQNSMAQRKKSALLISIAVGLYIFSIIPVIIFSEMDGDVPETIGVVLMFLFSGVATMLLVYNGVSKPKYRKEDYTVVEEFKEYVSEKEKDKSLRRSIKSAIWTLIVAFYFFMSFRYGIWAYSWIIFILGAAVTNIIDAVFQLKR